MMVKYLCLPLSLFSFILFGGLMAIQIIFNPKTIAIEFGLGKNGKEDGSKPSSLVWGYNRKEDGSK